MMFDKRNTYIICHTTGRLGIFTRKISKIDNNMSTKSIKILDNQYFCGGFNPKFPEIDVFGVNQ